MASPMVRNRELTLRRAHNEPSKVKWAVTYARGSFSTDSVSANTRRHGSKREALITVAERPSRFTGNRPPNQIAIWVKDRTVSDRGNDRTENWEIFAIHKLRALPRVFAANGVASDRFNDFLRQTKKTKRGGLFRRVTQRKLDRA